MEQKMSKADFIEKWKKDKKEKAVQRAKMHSFLSRRHDLELLGRRLRKGRYI